MSGSGRHSNLLYSNHSRPVIAGPYRTVEYTVQHSFLHQSRPDQRSLATTRRVAPTGLRRMAVSRNRSAILTPKASGLLVLRHIARTVCAANRRRGVRPAHHRIRIFTASPAVARLSESRSSLVGTTWWRACAMKRAAGNYRSIFCLVNGAEGSLARPSWSG